MKKYFILQITSYAGGDTARDQSGGETAEHSDRLSTYPGDTLYAVIVVEGDHAEIVDDGYRSYEEAKTTWPNAS